MQKKQQSEEDRLQAWIEEKLGADEWMLDQNVLTEKMKTLCYQVFFENEKGAEWLKMLEYQYCTNPFVGTDINHESMILKEGVRMVIHSIIEYAKQHARPDTVPSSQQGAQGYTAKHVRRSRR